MTAKLRASQLLRKVPAILERHGFTQGELEDSSGRVCVLGALAIADNDAFIKPTGARDLAGDYLESVVGYYDVVEWNDELGRTAVDVAIACRLAARIAADCGD